ncbi:long-chain fatty-acid--CoA ligase domain protein [Mycobacterium ulcerans str. Harvey]|uniref:Long-chain fatty-acid--CoA ligase domain protein n=1 Tax=Mycobacterium ulcerans str. Harvey TaxID=1299332 RepID=A0ABN0QKT6_MYCUL|nr:long-chain fatty-acid--CoA ligase domain protein [Mycobacterium ulcerans str. Harvey]
MGELGALPLFHAFGQDRRAQRRSRRRRMPDPDPRFSPEKALQISSETGSLFFEGVPTMFAAMLHSTERPDTGSLRLCVSGWCRDAGRVMRGFEQAFGTMVLEGTA